MLVGLVGLCFAEAGSRVSRSGGLYGYACAAFGPVTGGVTGALLLFANSIAGAAAIARFLLDTLALPFPILAQPIAGSPCWSAFISFWSSSTSSARAAARG